MEQFALAKVQYHYRIVKICQHNTRASQCHNYTYHVIWGHSNIFDQDVFRVARRDLLSGQMLSHANKLYFVGPQYTMDELINYIIGSIILVMHHFVMLQWLTALWYWNPAYREPFDTIAPTYSYDDLMTINAQISDAQEQCSKMSIMIHRGCKLVFHGSTKLSHLSYTYMDCFWYVLCVFTLNISDIKKERPFIIVVVLRKTPHFCTKLNN